MSAAETSAWPRVSWSEEMPDSAIAQYLAHAPQTLILNPRRWQAMDLIERSRIIALMQNRDEAGPAPYAVSRRVPMQALTGAGSYRPLWSYPEEFWSWMLALQPPRPAKKTAGRWAMVVLWLAFTFSHILAMVPANVVANETPSMACILDLNCPETS